ncbi:hypothetical protein Mapa_003154 [Marchantia paleacea]|nr:hypothetical protein Mapa_003154 [Marchantia paleacea]
MGGMDGRRRQLILDCVGVATGELFSRQPGSQWLRRSRKQQKEVKMDPRNLRSYMNRPRGVAKPNTAHPWPASQDTPPHCTVSSINAVHYASNDSAPLAFALATILVPAAQAAAYNISSLGLPPRLRLPGP